MLVLIEIELVELPSAAWQVIINHARHEPEMAHGIIGEAMLVNFDYYFKDIAGESPASFQLMIKC